MARRPGLASSATSAAEADEPWPPGDGLCCRGGWPPGSGTARREIGGLSTWQRCSGAGGVCKGQVNGRPRAVGAGRICYERAAMDSEGRISWVRSSPGSLARPGTPGRLRSFDPSRVAGLECAAWVAYYRRRWLRLLVAAIGLVRAGLGMSWPATVRAAWFMLRAVQLWAPVPVNDPERARRFMRRF